MAIGAIGVIAGAGQCRDEGGMQTTSSSDASPMFRRRHILPAAIALLGACSTVKPARMVPQDVPIRQTVQIPTRVRLASLEGDKSSSFGIYDDSRFAEALLAALKQSRLFADVSEKDGEIDLTVRVLTQAHDTDLRSMRTTMRLVAAYSFTGRDGTPVWSETYDTSFSSGNLGGAQRHIDSYEGAVRESIASLLMGIAERWPRK